MTGMKSHAFGCACVSHAARPWNRPEHWTPAEADQLERFYGVLADATIARKLKRSVVGIRLKAKRLGLHKRDAGWSARSVAEIFGVDPSVVSKVWIRRGLMPAIAPTMQAGRPSQHASRWVIDTSFVERFIHEHPEWVDIGKMPDSPFRDVAARDPWISMAEVFLRTGKDHHRISLRIRAGEIEGRKRGSHWFIPEREIGKIRPLAPDNLDEANFRRQSRLEHRRNRRKLVAA